MAARCALSLLAALMLAGCTALAPRCDRPGYPVAVDPGHTPTRPGATSAYGVPERTFNLELARQLLERLHADGYTASFATHAADDEITLRDRTRIANERGARLFISIHHDSAQPQLLQIWRYDNRELFHTDRISGHSLFVSKRNPRFDSSLRFARRIGERLRAAGLVPTLHHADDIPGERRELLDTRLGIHRHDDLIVLHSATMPAVLFEAGVIVNHHDEPLLRSDAHRRKLVDAIVGAVAEQCAAGLDQGRGKRAAPPPRNWHAQFGPAAHAP